MPALLLLSAIAVPCGEALGQGAGATGLEAPSPRWRLAASPLASVGHSADDPLYEVRGAVVFDSHFVVGERSSGTLRFYRLDGTFRKAVGRLGEGPGEFSSLSWVREFNDRLYAYDARLHRLTWYSPDGLFLESVQVRPFGRYVAVPVVGVFPDGSILAEGYRAPYLPARPEVRRDEVTLLLFDENGIFVDSLGAYPGSEYFTEPYGSRGRTVSPRVLGRRSQVAVVDSTYIVLDNTGPGLKTYEPGGTPIGDLVPDRLPTPVPVRREHLDQVRAYALSLGGPESASRVDELFERMEMPEELPLYGWASWRGRDMMASDGDQVWVLNYGGLSGDPPTWTVFGLGAGELGRLEAADDVVLLDVHGDLAVVLRTSEYDEEIVELRRILPGR